MRKLTDADFALLVLVTTARTGGITGYEIAEMMADGRGGLLGRSPAWMYARLPMLADRGFLDAEDVEGRWRKGAVRYVTSDSGIRAVRDWLGEHRARLPWFDDSEAFVFIRGMWLETPSVIWHGLKGMVFEIELRLQELEGHELRARAQGELPERYQRRLEFSYTRHLLNAYKLWLDEVRREFEEPDPLSDDPE